MIRKCSNGKYQLNKDNYNFINNILSCSFIELYFVENRKV